MDIYEITAWLNAVADAQIELWGEIPDEERDEAWCFLREWREQLQDAAWAAGG